MEMRTGSNHGKSVCAVKTTGKYPAGTRVRVMSRGSQHDGRVGVVNDVSRFNVWVVLDDTGGATLDSRTVPYIEEELILETGAVQG